MSYLSHLNADLTTLVIRWPRYLLYLAVAVVALVFSGSINLNPITWRAVLFTGSFGSTADLDSAREALSQFGNIEVIEDTGALADIEALSRHKAAWGVSRQGNAFVVTRNPAFAQDDGTFRALTYMINLALTKVDGKHVRDAIMLDALLQEKAEESVAFPPATAAPRPPEWLFLPKLIAFVVALLPFFLAIDMTNKDAQNRAVLVQLAARQGGFVSYIWAKATVCVLFTLCVLLLLLLATRAFFGLTPKGGLGLLVGTQLAAAAASAGYGFAIAVIMGSSRQVYGAVAAYFLALSLLSGFLFPLDAAAGYVRGLSWLVPLSFSLPILEKWLVHGQSPSLDHIATTALALQAAAALAVMTMMAWLARRSF